MTTIYYHHLYLIVLYIKATCLTHEVKDERIITSNEGIGIDFGLKDQFITKNETIPSINKSKQVKKLEKKLKQKQRALSRLKQKPSFIVIEDLNIKGLMKNKHLSKTISNAQWYMSRLFLTNQCKKLGIELRLAPRFYPSSKLCSCCGYKNTELKLKDRIWTCPKCNVVHNRDKNASLNLEQCQNYTVLTTV